MQKAHIVAASRAHCCTCLFEIYVTNSTADFENFFAAAIVGKALLLLKGASGDKFSFVLGFAYVCTPQLLFGRGCSV